MACETKHEAESDSSQPPQIACQKAATIFPQFSLIELENFMKTSMIAALAFASLISAFSAQTQASEPMKRMTPEQREAKRQESIARFNALSREEKAARKGHKVMPVRPGAPQGARGR